MHPSTNKAFANNGQPKREQHHKSDVTMPAVTSSCELTV
jgi:hypothetical protein